MNISIEDIELIVIEPEDIVRVDAIHEIIDLSYLDNQDYQQFEEEILHLTNEERIKRGLHPLIRDSHLDQAALTHTLDMIEKGFFSHIGSDGSNVASRVLRTGYRWVVVGENLAMGQRTPAEAVCGWMNSPGHRANLLNDKYFEIGVAYVEGNIRASNGTLWCGGYWTQNFGTRLTMEQIAPIAVKQLQEVISYLIKPKQIEQNDLDIVILEEQLRYDHGG